MTLAAGYLVNTVTSHVQRTGTGAQVFRAGTLVTNPDVLAAVADAGGQTVLANDVTRAAAATVAKLRQKGVDELTLQGVMMAAVAANVAAGGVVHLRNVVPSIAAVNPYVNAAAFSITLPDNAKSTRVAASPGAWARSGTGTLGNLSIVAPSNAEPSAGQVLVSASGDLLFNHTDAFTLVDVTYLPERQDVVQAVYTCTPGTGVVNGLPSGIISVLEAEALAGGVVGKCIVQLPAASAPTTGLAGLSLGKTGVFFCIADAVTSVRLKLGIVPAINA